MKTDKSRRKILPSCFAWMHTWYHWPTKKARGKELKVKTISPSQKSVAQKEIPRKVPQQIKNKKDD